ncbi:MAG: GNAT superfamily N-acetyltransferase [Verrucomicrobiales bacterium]|jgi:GNAT superfamily N-acetyltransferase
METSGFMRIQTAVAADLERVAAEVSVLDPGRGTATFSVGDGRAILLGEGLYVNRAIGVLFLDDHLLDEFEARSAAAGQAPAIEVSEATDPEFVKRLTSRGYESAGSAALMSRRLRSDEHFEGTERFSLERVTRDIVDVWCETTARGWGHEANDARATSDLYARAAFAAQDPGLLLARSTQDRRVVGCAALAVVDGIGLLGGMSALPHERGHGLQLALIAHRLRLASDRGCDLAATQAANSLSQRNLETSGFVQIQQVRTLRRPIVET